MITDAIRLDTFATKSTLWIANRGDVLAGYIKESDGLWYPVLRKDEFDTCGFFPREAEVTDQNRPLATYELLAAADNASATIERVR